MPVVTDERQLLILMRKTLAEIAKDTSCAPGECHPLRQSTIDAIRKCFEHIAKREQELASEQGYTQNEYPRYADEKKTSEVLKFVPSSKK